MKKKSDIRLSPRANRVEVRVPHAVAPWTQNFYDPIIEALVWVGQRVSPRDLLDAMVTGEALDAFERAKVSRASDGARRHYLPVSRVADFP